jgi:isoquinoline 1-oxidoreductase beta subunit
VRTPLVGGGFGRRLEIDYALEAATLARDCAYPVQVMWSREEDFRGDFHRPAAAARLRAAFGSDGDLRALEIGVALASASSGVAGLAWLPYRVPVSVARASLARGVRTGAWRSVDLSQNAFFREAFLDECAAHAKRDPLDLRLSLLPSDTRARGVLEAVARLAGWRERGAAGRHLGLAYAEGWGSHCAIVAEATLAAGRVRITHCYAAVDCGTTVNPSSAAAQVEGGIAMALSATLLEEAVAKVGRVQSASYGSYPILSFPHCPPIEVVFLESPDAAVGGLGELAVPPTAPAVANAVFAATGLRVRSLPLRSDARLKLAAQ